MTDRLFFAFWPDDALRQAIAARLEDWLGGYPGRRQRPDQWHLTVEFLGSVERSRQATLQALGAEMASCWPEAPRLVLDRLEHWKKPRVLCATAGEVPTAVRGWVEAFRSGLAARGFEPECRDFRPHLTLARKAKAPVEARAIEPLSWPVDCLALVRSITDPAGSRYEPLARWNLVQAPSPQPSPAGCGRGGETGV